MIKLDLFRYVLKGHPIGSDEEVTVDCNFTPYTIFVLFSRLNPYIFKLLRKRNKESGKYKFSESIYEDYHDIFNIQIKGIYNSTENKMEEYLHIVQILPSQPGKINDGDELAINLTAKEKEKIEKRLKKIQSENPDYALINLKEFYRSLPNHFQYPFSWFRSVVEYTGIDSSYNPFVTKEGIYLKFNPLADFNTAYYEVCQFLHKRIKEFYEKGVISIDSIIDSKDRTNFVNDWNLVNIDDFSDLKKYTDVSQFERHLFQANWRDKRFAPNIIDFLMRKVQRDPYIRFPLIDNLVKRHGIISALQKQGASSILEGNTLKVKASNLEEAQRFADTYDKALSEINGQVLTLAASRLSEISLYLQYNEKEKLGQAIFYEVNDLYNPYMFSILLNQKSRVSLNYLRTEIKKFALNALISTSKISKFKNSSPHDIIEQEYS